MHRATIKTMMRRGALFAILLASVVVLAACGDAQQALAPPDADVDGIQTVVVFPVTNETQQRELETLVAADLVARLGEVGWYDVLPPERVADELSERRIDPVDREYDAQQWREAARDIGMTLDADGFILAVVTAYDEAVSVASAYAGPETEEGVEWFADQTTEVKVTVRGKLVNVHTDATVYERTVTGTGRIVDVRQLNWAVPEAPPASIVPAPHRRNIHLARERAVADALTRLTADILPRAAEDETDDD